MKTLKESKWLATMAVVFLLFTTRGWCAGGASLQFTNKIASFRDIDGGTYPMAKIVRADFYADGTGRLIYQTNDDYGTISFARLSPDTLKYIGVPDNYAQLARNADAQRAEAAQQELQANANEEQRLLDPANLVSVRVDLVISKTAYDAAYGDLYTCQVHIGQNPASLKVLVAKLPPRIGEYYQKVADLQQSIAAEQAQIAAQREQVAGGFMRLNQQQQQINQQAAVVNDSTAGMGDWVYPAQIQRQAIVEANRAQHRAAGVLTNAEQEISFSEKQLTDQQKQLQDLQDGQATATTLLMMPGRRTFNGFRVLLCAPETVQPQPTAAPAVTNSTAI